MANGNFPYTNWYITTPNDHTSHFLSYNLFINIYGAIVIGVPQYVFINNYYESIYLAKPKSANFIMNYLFIRIFASFISRCTIPF